MIQVNMKKTNNEDEHEKDKEPSNICIKLNLSEEEFYNETTFENDLATQYNSSLQPEMNLAT